MNKNSIVVKRGFMDIHYYYIPISKVKGGDGHGVWLDIPKTDIINNIYESEEQPDPLRHYTKGRGYSDTDIRNTRDKLLSVTVISHKGHTMR